MTITLEQLEQVLVNAYPGASHPVLSRAVAVQRAQWLYSDLQAWRFDLRLTDQPIKFDGMQTMHVPKYRLADSPFNASKGPDDREKGEDHEMFHGEGSGLDCPDLLKLSRVSEIGHTILAHTNWPRTHAKRLRDPREHVPVIEEILWLGRWRNPVAVRLNAKLVLGSAKDVDCCFRSEGITINLEVKYRPRTWLAGVDGGFGVRDLSSLFDGVDGKFPVDLPQGTYNVVALTIVAPIDNLLRHHVAQFLAARHEVAAVVVWTDHAPNGRNHEFISRPDGPARLLECLFKSDEEERCRAGFIRHPMRNTAERREMTPAESIRLMQRMAAEED